MKKESALEFLQKYKDLMEEYGLCVSNCDSFHDCELIVNDVDQDSIEAIYEHLYLDIIKHS